MGIFTQKGVALTGSRRLLVLIHHYLHNRGYGSDVWARECTGKGFVNHFLFFAAHLIGGFFIFQ
jgi:hypothetical protein